MSVAVVVPWRGGCAARARAWDWVRARYAARHPAWRIIAAEPPGAEWVKAAAIAAALGEVTADVVVVADADVWSPKIAAAVAHVLAGAPWAIPHRNVHRLTAAATAAALAGADPYGLGTAQRPYRGAPGGGIVVLPRATALEVPLDPRFVGWGGEDYAWGHALTCLAGRPWRADAPLVHLWHPPQPRITRQVGSLENEQLRGRYARAQRSPVAMRALLAEITR